MASGVNHKTYCGEYTLLAIVKIATTVKDVAARVGVRSNPKK